MVHAEFKQQDRRLCQEGQEASFPSSHIKRFAQGNATEPAHLTLACVLLPPAANWLCFSCSTPPWLVLSHNMPMINTTDSTSELALFCHFSITASFTSSHSLVLRGSPDPAVRPAAGLQVTRRRLARRHQLNRPLFYLPASRSGGRKLASFSRLSAALVGNFSKTPDIGSSESFRAQP